MPAKLVIRKGQIVALTFLDHTEGQEPGPETFTVWGRVTAVTPVAYVVAGWDYEPHRPADSNVTQWAVLRSTVQRIVCLVPKDAPHP